MEIELQNEAEKPAAEPELSPVEQLRKLWAQQTGISFLRQKTLISLHQDLLPYACVTSLAGWSSPRAFALQGLVAAAILTSLVNFYITRDIGPGTEQIQAVQADLQAEVARQQGIMDATQAETNRVLKSPRSTIWKSVSKEEALRQLGASMAESRKSLEDFKDKAAAREKELRARQQAEAVANSGTPLVFSLALVLAAGLVASGARRDFPRSNVRAAGDLYLYFATAGGVWLNLIFLLFLHFALSSGAYGLSVFSNTVGPLFWALFWIGFYLLFVRYLASVARHVGKALEIRPPASEWTLENRMLVRLHNSFLIVFAALEAMFLSVAYIAYLGMLRLS
jgi:hypothetical protein